MDQRTGLLDGIIKTQGEGVIQMCGQDHVGGHRRVRVSINPLLGFGLVHAYSLLVHWSCYGSVQRRREIATPAWRHRAAAHARCVTVSNDSRAVQMSN